MSCENSKRVQTSQESRKKKCGHKYKENCQCSGMEQKEYEPTGSVQYMRKMFEGSAKKTEESQKDKSNRESSEHDQRSGLEQQDTEPTGSVQAMRQKFEDPSKNPADSKKEKSARKSPRGRLSQESKKRDQANKSEHQDLKPSGSVQKMRQKFEVSSKNAAEDQKEECSHGGREHAQGSKVVHQEPGHSGPVQAMRQKYEALSDKPAKSQKEALSRNSTKGGQAPEAIYERDPSPRPTSGSNDQKPPNKREIGVVKKRRKRLPPSFKDLLSSTPKDFHGYMRQTDKEPTGMDPEGLQLGVEYQKHKEPAIVSDTREIKCHPKKDKKVFKYSPDDFFVSIIWKGIFFEKNKLKIQKKISTDEMHKI